MSRGFHFRLDAVLQQRVRQEQALQVALAQAVQAQTTTQRSLEQLQRQRAAATHQSVVLGKTFDPAERLHLLLHVDRLGREFQRQQRILHQQTEEIHRLQHLLLQAATRRRALERLRERRQTEYDHEQQRRAAHELDEYGTLRYARLSLERTDADGCISDS